MQQLYYIVFISKIGINFNIEYLHVKLYFTHWLSWLNACNHLMWCIKQKLWQSIKT